jgi:phosphotransferase system enzyme I (PtsI)
MAERRLSGRCAAPGLAQGMAVLLTAGRLAPRSAGSPAQEAAALHQALAQARLALEALAAQARGEAADMLGLQIAMLEDDELARPALAAIAAGDDAQTAWLAAMDAEIAGYAAARDAHFAARTADLEDLRDRVQALLAPAPPRAGGPAGALPSDALPSGAMPAGTMPAGTMPAGTVTAGTVPAGTVPVGTVTAGAVVVAADLPLSRFLAIDWRQGGAILLTAGSPASHVAMLARARGVPMVVGLGGTPEQLAGHAALVDAARGEVVLDPGAEALARFAASGRAQRAGDAAAAFWRHRPAVTADGTAVRVQLNVSDPAELDGLDPAICDGIGLVRTELLFHAAHGLPADRQDSLPIDGQDSLPADSQDSLPAEGQDGRQADTPHGLRADTPAGPPADAPNGSPNDGPHGLPGEAAQYRAYRRILEWAAGRPVTIRTLDAGGDKPIAGVTMDGESNPFLGLRGIRLSLHHRELFRIQLRALARAAVHGDLRIMLPMVTVPSELAAAAALLDEVLAGLAQDGTAAARPQLGIMVEVPAAAIAIEQFDADFFSIGSNDLTQYVTAAARDIGTVAALADPLNPAVLRLIEAVVRHAGAVGREVSLCGDAAAAPDLLAPLLRTGLRRLSVAPAALDRVKQAIAAIRLDEPGR